MDKDIEQKVIKEYVKGTPESTIVAQTGASQSAVNRLKQKNKEKIQVASQKLIDKGLDTVISNKLSVIKDSQEVYKVLVAELLLDGTPAEKIAFMKMAQSNEDNLLKATGIFQGNQPAFVFNQTNVDNSNNTVVAPGVMDLMTKYATSHDDDAVDVEVIE